MRAGWPPTGPVTVSQLRDVGGLLRPASLPETIRGRLPCPDEVGRSGAASSTSRARDGGIPGAQRTSGGPWTAYSAATVALGLLPWRAGGCDEEQQYRPHRILGATLSVRGSYHLILGAECVTELHGAVEVRARWWRLAHEPRYL